ncbi:hypothetical protein KYD79_26520, partial [Escherichia coli]|nr:hypothetical protein [Escherichia coli]
MAQANSVPTIQRTGVMVCPCRKYKNSKAQTIDDVGTHLFNRGFTPEYYVWFYHGEGYEDETSGSTSYQPMDQGYSNEQYDQHQFVIENDDHDVGLKHNRFEEMVTDAFPGVMSTPDVAEEPNVDAKNFYDMLDSAKQPIYEGCREGLSKLSLASRMMTIKSDHNQSESCMDDWAALLKEYLPEGNEVAESYYDIHKLVSSLGLPSQMIDVCIDNCMIFWKDDEDLQECRFCHKPRFKPQGAGRSKVPYQRMWYLPITDRLQRLYHSERTAASMRWHAEHSTIEGEVHHPSDAKAWKHFKSVHSNFAKEKRNVYLGLCTDGFSPFGMSGRQYSLWPVILTPYNLPPDMCMQKKFLFLSILVPGPKHPRRSIDVFLQPLIQELNMLWSHGVRTFDYSRKKNFTMRAVLMWTISDFPAYGMLSGWTTHGRLSCPYCQNETDAFQLKNGGKSCWFDCHRRFLPMNHPYRGNRRLFT